MSGQQSISPERIRLLLGNRIKQTLGSDLKSVFLYGSKARGDSTPESDWDVLVILQDSAESESARAKMRRLSAMIAEETGEVISILTVKLSEADGNAGLLKNVAEEGEKL
jgi:type I restriction enzyme S subunit